MKKSNLTIRVAIAATFFTLSYVSIADAQTSPDTNKNQTDTDKPVDVGRLKSQPNPKKHRMPSNSYIEYQYDGNGILILSTDRYEHLTLTVSNATYNVSADLSIENGMYLETGPLAGSYLLECITNDGALYSGTINVTLPD